MGTQEQLDKIQDIFPRMKYKKLKNEKHKRKVRDIQDQFREFKVCLKYVPEIRKKDKLPKLKTLIQSENAH